MPEKWRRDWLGLSTCLSHPRRRPNMSWTVHFKLDTNVRWYLFTSINFIYWNIQFFNLVFILMYNWVNRRFLILLCDIYGQNSKQTLIGDNSTEFLPLLPLYLSLKYKKICLNFKMTYRFYVIISRNSVILVYLGVKSWGLFSSKR